MKLYNSRIIDTYIKFIEKNYSHININQLLTHAGMHRYEVADQSHWFTQNQIDLFYDKLVEITNIPNIAREAGRYAASPDALGIMRHYILGMLSPTSFFLLSGKTADKLTKSSIYSAKKVGRNKVELTVTPRSGVTEKFFQCENRIGFFEAFLLMFNHGIPTIHHPECTFRGDKVCRYIISWKSNWSSALALVRNFAIFPIMLFGFLLPTYFQEINYYQSFFASLFLITALTLLLEWARKTDALKSIEMLSDAAEKLVDQTNLTDRNMEMANEIGLAISGKISINEILEGVTKILREKLDYERGLILLANHDRSQLQFKAGFGYNKEQLSVLDKTSFQLDRPKAKGSFVVTFREQKSILVNNISEIEASLSSRSLAMARALGVNAFVCCPIVCDGKSLGVIAMENIKGRPLLQSDLSQLMGIAPVIGIAIRNAELLEAQENLFKSTLKALAASIDARDPLTAGHSEKVTEYSIGICEELDVDQDYREVVRVAALLHDYGKIAVPDSILKKPGKLTLEEREAVKTHAFKTRDILEQINFEGKFKEVPAIAAAHHEKLDGSGYPAGLKGGEIPLGAKIIAVADFFEAITSKRHYREPMPVAAAFQLLRAEAGTHFQKDIVEAFFLWYRRTYAEGRLPTEERRRLRIPLKTSVAISFDGCHHLGHSVDLSTGGAFISTAGTPKEGALIDLAFTLPADPGRVAARGRVAWVNPPATTKKPTFPAGFGVEFVEFKEQSGAHLQGFLTDTIRSEHVWAT